MNYELAKKLKDAGFPQIKYSKSLDDYFEVDGQRTYCPTLSELIEACGRMDFKLRQTYSAYENKVFYVIEIPGDNDMERRDTPEEALANLYLKLHEKTK